MHSVTSIEDTEQLDTILTAAQNSSPEPKLVIIDFYADWCQPCKKISPVFERLSMEYKMAKFLKCNTVTAESVRDRYNISRLPTFLFFRGNQLVDRLDGSNEVNLQNKIQNLVQGSTEAESKVLQQSNSKQPDLDSLVAKGQCECLNEHDFHSLSKLWNSPEGTSYILSDTDEQLIFHVIFMQTVRIQALQLVGPCTNGPKEIRLFINRISTPSFDSCETDQPTQSLILTEKDIEHEAVINLNYVKFQNINSLTIFVRSNQHEEPVTRIDKLKFFGVPVSTTNMNDFKRVSGKKGEAHG